LPISKGLGSSPDRVDKKRVTILVVEDDLNLLDGLHDLLETYEEGKYVLDVLTAVNGIEALSVLETRIPDLIISDIMMPKMDGYNLLQAVRSRPEWLQIRFIFLTAIGNPPDKHKAYIMGVDEYITKPYESDRLLETVEAQLDRQFLMQKMLNQDFNALKNAILNLVTPTFQQPLSFVSQSIELMRQNETVDNFQDALQNVQKGSAWLKQLIEDFMTLAEFKTGEANDAFTYHAHILPNVAVLLAEFTQLHASELKKQGVLLKFQASDTQHSPILGDVSQLSGCLRRLIEVGLHYSSQTNEHHTVTLFSQQVEHALHIDLGFHGNIATEAAQTIKQLLIPQASNAILFRTFDFATDLAIVQGHIALHRGIVSLHLISSSRFLFRLELPIAPDMSI
jgi:CheY-like chemotaxis protein